MKLLVILLISFSGIAQNEVAYEFASYQNKDITKSNVPIVKVHHYMKIYTTGKVEAINKDGKCSTHYLDSRLTNQLNTATAKGLEEFRNKMTLPENHFYAGFYSYLKMGEETVCFNPYNVEGQLKKALKDIENSIEEEKTNVRSNCSFPTNLAQSIRDTHS